MHENSYNKMKMYNPQHAIGADGADEALKLESVQKTPGFEAYFIQIYRNILNAGIDYNIERDEYVDSASRNYEKMGRVLKTQMDHHLASFNLKDENFKSVAAQGALIQKLFLHILIQGIDLRSISNESFIKGFSEDGDEEKQKEVLEFLERHIKGAETSYEYYLNLRDEPDVIYIGINQDLDIYHNIDFVVVRTKEVDSQNTGPSIDTVELVQIKSSLVKLKDFGIIHRDHFDFAKTQKQSILNGLDTKESQDAFARLEKKDAEAVKMYLRIRFKFIKILISKLSLGFSINSWKDFDKLATEINHDPILVMIRLNNLNSFIIEKLLSKEEVALLNELKEALSKISIPTKVLGVAERAYNTRGSSFKTGFATEWKSVIAYKELGQWKYSIRDIKSM